MLAPYRPPKMVQARAGVRRRMACSGPPATPFKTLTANPSPVPSAWSRTRAWFGTVCPYTWGTVD